MSLNVFFTLCILGIDFLIYVLFQWTYGEKHRSPRRLSNQGNCEREVPRPSPRSKDTWIKIDGKWKSANASAVRIPAEPAQ